MTSFSHHLIDILTAINHVLWGIPAVVLLFGTGIYLTTQLRFIQLTRLMQGMRFAFGKQQKQEGSISRFEALATSLSGAIGTGNIAGVALAISMGGPGAVFWMWVSAIFGMATKYTSCTLAIQYRERTKTGHILGGPMYTLKNALNMPKLGGCFAILMLLSCFGTGNTVQANSIAAGLRTIIPTQQDHTLLVGIILSIAVGIVIIGGVKRIAKVASFVVPFMATLYFLTGIVILALNYHLVPHMLFSIFNMALNPHAATGAAMGMAVRYGLARGIFSNEAGLGSAPIAHAAACTGNASHQGLVAMIDPLIDTLLVCTTTALVILITAGDPSIGTLQGAELSAAAFQAGLSNVGIHHIGAYVVGLGLIFFAYTTIVAWCYYGEQCLRYLLGDRVQQHYLLAYRILFTLAVIPGAMLPLNLVWQVADLTNILMAVPNVISLILLAKVVKKLSYPSTTNAEQKTDHS